MEGGFAIGGGGIVVVQNMEEEELAGQKMEDRSMDNNRDHY